MDAVAQHQQHRVVELVVDRDRPGSKVATSRTASSPGGSGRSSASRRSVVVKMPRRSPSRTSASPQAPRGQLPAEADEVGAAVDEERLAHEGVAHPRRHQRHELAPLAPGARPARPAPEWGAAASTGRLVLAGGSRHRHRASPVAQCAGRLGRADAGLRAHLLRRGSRPGRLAAGAAVEHREQPDAEEAERHREQRRRGVGERRRALGLPSVASQTEGDSTVSTTEEISPRKPPITAPARGAVLPQHRHEQHREVGRRGDREGQRHHEGDVLLLEGDAERTATMPSATVVIRETFSSAALSALPFLNTVA